MIRRSRLKKLFNKVRDINYYIQKLSGDPNITDEAMRLFDINERTEQRVKLKTELFGEIQRSDTLDDKLKQIK